MRATPKTVYFRLNHAASLDSLPVSTLPVGWSLKALSASTERRDFYDTFEWQAFRKGIVIVEKQEAIFLVALNTGQELSSLPHTRICSSFFSDQLPACKFKELLCSCSTIRAFTRLCSIDAFTRSYRILDNNEKTIATLTSESLYLANSESPEPLTHLITLSPLKGYEEEVAPIKTLLSSHTEISTVLDFKALFQLIIHAAGRKAEDYSSKIILTLHPDAPIHESARQLLQSTMYVMRKNEEGIKKNIDSEFLHDYRVAIRRSRSLLKQLKGIFDDRETTYFLNFFRDLGKKSNELRDRDVYLLRQTTYFHYLPPFLQPSLKPFFVNISSSRSGLHKRFCRYLSSSDYRSFLDELERFLNPLSIPNPENAPNASLSTKSVAMTSIKKAWKKVIRHGHQISRKTTDSELHALRIDCKKLRYLLEFFSSIFPAETIASVIRQLKELQENLGDFVDFSVQLCFLHEQFALVPADKLLSASMGGLMATLFQKQEEARLKFHKTFRLFDHEDTNQLFRDLLTDTCQ